MFRWIRCMAAALPLLAAGFAYGEIAGSKHDFSAAGWSDNQICKPCHTPHNAISTDLTGRLWAHTLSTQTYTYHGSRTTTADGMGTTDGANGSAAQTDMDSVSRMCLSCHDGTVALDSFLGKDGTPDGVVIGGDADHGAATANLGADLSNDHPVGFKALYDETKGSAGHYYYNPASAVTAAGLKLAKSPTLFAAGKVAQDGTTQLAGTNVPSVSCGTCHNVHNSGAPDEPGLLRISNAGSAMCLTCHPK